MLFPQNQRKVLSGKLFEGALARLNAQERFDFVARGSVERFAIDAAGKLPSEIIISSPCPISMSIFNNSGESIWGIFFILAANEAKTK